MSFQEIQSAIKAAKPAPGKKCDLCGASLEKVGSIVAGTTVLLKRIEKRVCLVCAKEVKSLIDLRITQVEKGEYQA